MEEAEKIKERYEKRRKDHPVEDGVFIQHVIKEREAVYSQIISEHFKRNKEISFLEIGAGEGANIHFFRSLGIPDKNITAAELLPDRAEVLRTEFPGISVKEGNALTLEFENKFDIVFQSLVFTSILDDAFKKQLALKMLDLLKPGGIILWYDFRFNNPNNKDVKGVDKKEIRDLFSKAEQISFTAVTLAPPIGRRVGGLYSLINSVFPFLRTHLIALIKK